VRSIAFWLLLIGAVGLPVIAVLLIRWSRRRARQLKGHFGNWTRNEAAILQRQAEHRGDWRSASQWVLLAPVWAKHERLAQFVLCLAIGVLVGFAALVVFALFNRAPAAG
jgi:hypothetical protein